MELNCNVLDDNNILLVHVRGKLIRSSIAAFKKEILSRIPSCSHIVLNLQDMIKIDNYGMDALLYVQIKALNQDVGMKLAEIQPGPRVLFDITETYKVFDIFDSQQAALESCETR